MAFKPKGSTKVTADKRLVIAVYGKAGTQKTASSLMNFDDDVNVALVNFDRDGTETISRLQAENKIKNLYIYDMTDGISDMKSQADQSIKVISNFRDWQNGEYLDQMNAREITVDGEKRMVDYFDVIVYDGISLYQEYLYNTALAITSSTEKTQKKAHYAALAMVESEFKKVFNNKILNRIYGAHQVLIFGQTDGFKEDDKPKMDFRGGFNGADDFALTCSIILQNINSKLSKDAIEKGHDPRYDGYESIFNNGGTQGKTRVSLPEIGTNYDTTLLQALRKIGRLPITK